ncbi:hypothetical protein F5B19DRAFT_218735 [Rostrohypoxylon terebratum]|nr:hypothetical protein F5B19DRAFT_218735 [Rostrohypoxylon terebratum]
MNSSNSSNSIKLPRELVSHICNILYRTHPSGLLNFARCSKACHAIAAISLSHTIWIFVAAPTNLILAVRDHLERLRRYGTLWAVHRLVIYGPGVEYSCMDRIESHPMIRPMVDLEGRFNKPRPCPYQFRKLSPAKVYEVNHLWLPLAELIRQLPSLADLIYQCYPSQFPPCLLEALHQHRPKCRLHIDNFHLRSLDANPPIADPHEFMIVTSPCLHSINTIADKKSNSAPAHHVGAVLRMVSGLAPNLKEVHLFRNRERRWDESEEHSSFVPTWRNLPISQECPGVMGSLSCLQLWGLNTLVRSRVEPHVLKDWSRHTDFSVLQALKINTILTSSALEYLVDVSNNFQSLENLVLTLGELESSYSLTIDRNLSRLAGKLVGSLKGLRTLEIAGWSRGFDTGTRWGSELRTLILRSFRDECPTVRDIANIREQCPLLETLKIAICRTGGDANETALYRELGAFPRLKNLSLKMDAQFPGLLYQIGPTDLPPPPPAGPDFDQFDREPFADSNYLKGHVRSGFINGAMDATLALDIFETISKVKETYNLVLLEKLRIKYEDVWDFPFKHKFCYLGKYGIPLFGAWQVERSSEAHSRHVLLVTKLDKLDKKDIDLEEWRWKSLFQDKFPDIPMADPAELELVFRRIWPERWEGSDWRDDWHSIPLSKSTS